MSASQEDSVPVIESILHPSDFSAASEVAFAHALKAALIAKSQLTIIGLNIEKLPYGATCGFTSSERCFEGIRRVNFAENEE